MGKSKKKQKTVREFSAGGLVFKEKKSIISWLIIKPAGTERWQFPKGQIDKGETSRESALREVEEEGGVKAEIIKKVEDSHYFFYFQGKRIYKTVTFYLMKYLRETVDGHDQEVDEAIFVPFKEAEKKLSFKDDREILEKAKVSVDQGIQGNLI